MSRSPNHPLNDSSGSAFDAVVFDLDGTLTDSMPFHAEAWCESFRSLTGDELPEAEPYAHEGEKGEHFARYIFTKYSSPPSDALIADATARYVAAFAKLYELRFFPCAEELIRSLRERGVPLGLVSGSKQVRERFAEHPAFIGAFSAVVSGDDTPVGKPEPAPFLKAFEILGVSASDALVIENAPFGIRAAKSAGAHCWAVLNNSLLSKEELLACGADEAFVDLSAVAASLGVLHRGGEKHRD